MSREKKEKKLKKDKKNIFPKLLIGIDMIAIVCFFIAYGPFSFFRDWLVTTAMTTMSHKYFAYVLYSDEMIEKVLDNNRVIETDESTDITAIDTSASLDTGVYESIYEEQVLKREEGNNIYKVVDIKGNNWKGYMVVVYDPSRLRLVFSKKYGKGGDYVSTIAKDSNAYIAINASGVQTKVGVNRITGEAILDGKIADQGRAINKGGGLIGFNKDNVLVLTKKTASEAIKEYNMDRAVEFGPFLVVNGKMSEFKGNGGWGIANRTAIGQRQDGIVLLIVIDGRTSLSAGISMKELAELFVKYKAYNAANLDGGGSSILYGKRDINATKSEIISNPKGYNYDGERRLPNAWMIIPQEGDIENND